MTVTSKKKTPTKWVFVPVVAAGLVGIWRLTPGESDFKEASTWQMMTQPGDLSEAHASLENNCAACHTAVIGLDSSKCTVCHANNESLLQRQPTSFHANIGSCKACHPEHQGRAYRPANMDHAALANIGLRQTNDVEFGGENTAMRALLLDQIRHSEAPHSRISPAEGFLNCNTCHANDDRHFKLFGDDCAQCHMTTKWTIPAFRHPSSRSRDCAQCHQAPPSHYMMHFSMISQKVAGQDHARVEQCYRCHQTTSWPDIKGVGWYKHH